MTKRNRILETKLYFQHYWKSLLSFIGAIGIFAILIFYGFQYENDRPKITGYRTGTIVKIIAELGSGPRNSSSHPPAFFVFVQFDFDPPIRTRYRSYFMPFDVGDQACVGIYRREKSERVVHKLAHPEKCGLPKNPAISDGAFQFISAN